MSNTNFVVNNGSYVNKDLIDIFTPVSDSGTYEVVYKNKFVSNIFKTWRKETSTSDIIGTNAFSQETNNGVVTTGIDANYNSYLEFNRPGIYKLDFSFRQTDEGQDPPDGYRQSWYIRLNDSINLSINSIPSFSDKNIINIQSSGTGGETSTTAFMLTNGYNEVERFTDSNHKLGYSYVRLDTTVYSNGVVANNFYSFSYIIKVFPRNLSNTLKLYFQIANSRFLNLDTNRQWRFVGNWTITNLVTYKPVIGSFLGDGTDYAQGTLKEVLGNKGGNGTNNAFTIEFFFRLNTIDVSQNLLMIGTSSAASGETTPYIFFNGTSKRMGLGLIDGGTSIQSNVITFSANQWYHYALTREETLTSTTNPRYSMFLDGTLIYSDNTFGNTLDASSNVITIGSTYQTNTGGLIGNISNVRITKGVAVYTGNFTVPSLPLQTTQSSSTNITAITSSQCIYLLQTYNLESFTDSVNADELDNYGLTFTTDRPT